MTLQEELESTVKEKDEIKKEVNRVKEENVVLIKRGDDLSSQLCNIQACLHRSVHKLSFVIHSKLVHLTCCNVLISPRLPFSISISEPIVYSDCCSGAVSRKSAGLSRKSAGLSGESSGLSGSVETV